MPPGPVDTPMTQALHTAKFREEYARAIPMNRYGTPSEVASAILYLVSEEAAYVSGIVMPVDGGLSCFGRSRNLREAQSSGAADKLFFGRCKCMWTIEKLLPVCT